MGQTGGREKKPNLVLKKIRVKVSLEALGVFDRGGSPGNRVGELDVEGGLSVNPHRIASNEINRNNLVIIVRKRDLLVGVEIGHHASIHSLPGESNKACGGKKGEEILSIAAQRRRKRKKKGSAYPRLEDRLHTGEENKKRKKRCGGRPRKVKSKSPFTNEHLVPVAVCNGVPELLQFRLVQLGRADGDIGDIFWQGTQRRVSLQRKSSKQKISNAYA